MCACLLTVSGGQPCIKLQFAQHCTLERMYTCVYMHVQCMPLSARPVAGWMRAWGLRKVPSLIYVRRAY